LWSLVIDELFNELTEQGYEVIGFADDLVIMIRGNDDSTVKSSAIGPESSYEIMSINPMKTVVTSRSRGDSSSV
jgi:hypothetical protein